MNKALIIVDEQNDFCEGGSLGVEGGKNVVLSTNAFLSKHADDYSVIVATRDWHEEDNDNGGHFAKNPDYVDTWPAHCVQGTYGGQYADELDVSFVQEHVVKGTGKPAYSGFQGFRMGSKVTLDEVLKEYDVTEVDVVGIAEDYCVKATALDAIELGYKTRVFSDLTTPVSKVNTALEEVFNAGGVIALSGIVDGQGKLDELLKNTEGVTDD